METRRWTPSGENHILIIFDLRNIAKKRSRVTFVTKNKTIIMTIFVIETSWRRQQTWSDLTTPVNVNIKDIFVSCGVREERGISTTTTTTLFW